MVLIPLHSGHDGFRFFVHDASILRTLPLNHNAKGAFQAPDCERSRLDSLDRYVIPWCMRNHYTKERVLGALPVAVALPVKYCLYARKSTEEEDRQALSSLEEKISSLLQKQNDWLEPMQEWIKDA